MNLLKSAQAYRRNSVLSASPGQLILMLFDGALRFMNTALAGFEEENAMRRIETIHTNLVKTQAILKELQCSLDTEKGGEFAKRMFSIYGFMRKQLHQANIQKDQAPIRVVIEMLGGIRQSWSEMLANGASSTQDISEAGEMSRTAA